MAPLRILALGDSITAGCGSLARPPSWSSGCENGSPAAGSGSYRAALFHALVESGVPASAFLFVGSQSSGPDSVPAEQRAHEGHAGWTVSQLTGISFLWAPLQPDAVLIHAGTNDAGGAHSVATFEADMAALINETLTAVSPPPARVLVATIIASAAGAQLEATIESYNAALPGVVARFPPSVVRLVDMHAGTAGLCRPGGGGAGDCCPLDGTHPTQAGYLLMAGVWWRFLAELFPMSAAVLARGLLPRTTPKLNPPAALAGRARCAGGYENNTAAILRPCNVSVADGRIAPVQRFAFSGSGSAPGALALGDGSGRCLAMAGCDGQDGISAVFVPCAAPGGGDACAAAAQGWSFPSGGAPFLLSAAGSNKCLELHGGCSTTQLDAWDCQANGIQNMLWRFNATSGALVSECTDGGCGGLCVTPADWQRSA